jgi:hypothetical protein
VLLIKGDNVIVELADGSALKLPPKYGIIHDPEGEVLDKCQFYLGPYKLTRVRTEMTKAARKYFGSDYVARRAVVDMPPRDAEWKEVGEAVQILYRRGGTRAPGRYFHFFKRLKAPITVSRRGSFYMLAIPDGSCVVYNDRGIVWP